jgi:hypothetical protein
MGMIMLDGQDRLRESWRLHGVTIENVEFRLEVKGMLSTELQQQSIT